MINIWGADHSGYVKRLENAIGAVNRSKKYNFEIKLTALVNLLENKKIIKMSKRQGNYITMREVAGKVGIDVLRFMMISRNADKKIDFDFEIVKQKSKDNPVFYIQYAHARCMSIIKTFNKTFDLSLDKDKDFFDFDLSNLRLDEEKILIRNLCNFFNVIISSATYYEPHRVSNYLFELSKDFHAYWGLGKNNLSKKIIIESNLDLSKSRLVLVFAISKVIKKGLDLLKIECPESM
jgi:arginyl-tRNA synthetase